MLRKVLKFFARLIFAYESVDVLPQGARLERYHCTRCDTDRRVWIEEDKKDDINNRRCVFCGSFMRKVTHDREIALSR